MLKNTMDSAVENSDGNENLEKSVVEPRKYEYKYTNIVKITYGYIVALYGIYLCFTTAKWSTIIFNYFLYVAATLGATAGVHRLWTHKSYKAKMPLQILLIVFNSLTNQHTAIYWVRDHILHHKYSDTDSDPHNASRGFFFSHVGWLMVKKHPKVIEKGKDLDLSELYNNPVLRFQHKYAYPFIGSVCFVIPTLVPMYCWDETFSCSYHLTMMRYVISLNVIFLVNSAGHLWGNKPYDKNIMPVDNTPISLLNLGESFHNYHHVFPWDYRAAELGNNYFNFTTMFIDFMAKIGWAYDLKTASEEVIISRKMRTGDGTDLQSCEVKESSSYERNEVLRRRPGS